MTHPMTEAERIAAGLSEAQRRALAHPNAGKCSYRWAPMRTVEALYNRGLCWRRADGRGTMFSPQTAIIWPLTPLGAQVRAILLKGTE